MTKLFDELQQSAGTLLVEWHDDEHARHLTDWSGHLNAKGSPLAIAYPQTTDEVAKLVRACAASGTVMVPQSGLTGMAGGAVPDAGCVVISLERMIKIEDLDQAGQLIVVQAGVPLQRIQEAASEAGLFFPLDLGARGSALIGGNLATNAGGNRVLRYGMARDLTLGLEIVTADGTVINAMNRMTKNNAGYDLKQIFIGSEGTLGVITRAVLRLFPKPSTQNVALCALTDYDAVLALLALGRDKLGDTLSAFEVMWDDFFDVATKGNARSLAFEGDYRFVVLVEAMGRDPTADSDGFQGFVEQAFGQAMIQDALVAQNQRDVDDFWAVRDASGELNQRFGRAVNFDVSVPVGELDRFAQACRSRIMAAIPQTRVLVFGHIADGNIHFSCLDEDGSAKKQIEEIVYATVGEWGGSISAEHGVGLEKRTYLKYSRSPSYIALMQTLKEALDPQNLMNPGKIL